MKISILTLFPGMFVGPFDLSIIKRAREQGIVEIDFSNIRDFGIGKHQVVDDTAYGGGVGMVMRVDVLHQAILHAKNKCQNATTENTAVVLMSAKGKRFTQERAEKYAKLTNLILICGHYEGVDERITRFIDEEVSVGDYVLTGGEIPAMIITDAVSRLLPGVLPEGATEAESFSQEGRLLEYPHYTKPQLYETFSVPDILLSGNHRLVEDWRREKSVEITKKHRPELLKKAKLK